MGITTFPDDFPPPVKDPYFRVALAVNCVIFGLGEKELEVLLIGGKDRNQQRWSLPRELMITGEQSGETAGRILEQHSLPEPIRLTQLPSLRFQYQHAEEPVIAVTYYSLTPSRQCMPGNLLHGPYWHKVTNGLPLPPNQRPIFEDCLNQLRDSLSNPLESIATMFAGTFSLRQLQHVYEIVLGKEVDRRNFCKRILALNILEDLKEWETGVPHRPGKLYRFKRKNPSWGKIIPSIR